MSILCRFTPSSITTEKYGQSVRRLQASGDFPADAWTTTAPTSSTEASESAKYGIRASSGKRSGSA